MQPHFARLYDDLLSPDLRMATAPDVNDREDEQGLKDLKQEITCPLCLDTFREPKLLSCDHVYCKLPCLEALLVRSKNSTIACPECRVVTQVTANDVNYLRTAFHINRLKEVVLRMKKCPIPPLPESDDEAVISTSDRLAVNMFCKLHPMQNLDIYCSTCACQRLICRDCVVVDRTHENHDYDLVERVAPGYKKALLESLDPVKETQGKVAKALSQVEKAKEQVTSHGDALKHQITHSFDEIAAALQQQREALVAHVQELEENDLQELDSAKKNLCIASDELASLVRSAQTAADGSDQQFFAQRQELFSRIAGLTARFETGLSLTPVAFPHVAVHIVSPNNIGSVVFEPVDPTKCHAEGVQDVATVDEPSNFRVYISDSNGNPCVIKQDVQVEMKSLRFGSVLPAQVTAISSSCYYVVYIPQLHTRGRYQLHVAVNTVPIANSPFTIHVKCHPNQLGTLSKTIPCSHRCFGLNFSPEGNLIVVVRQLGNITHSGFSWQRDAFGIVGEVQVFDPGFVKITRTLNFAVNNIAWFPTGVVTDSQSSSIYVSDQAKGQVLKYTKDSMIPVKTSNPVKLLPNADVSFNGLEISKNGSIFVCHSNKHRVEVLDSELTKMNQFGKRGSKPGQFNTPHDLSLDSQGNIYVTDSKNFRVQVLTQEGEFIRTFGTKGDKPGEFLCPNWIHVDGKFVYVTDYRSRYVSVFNVSGKFIHRFGADILGHPEGIVVDEDGFVYVSDSDKCMVFIF